MWYVGWDTYPRLPTDMHHLISKIPKRNSACRCDVIGYPNSCCHITSGIVSYLEPNTCMIMNNSCCRSQDTGGYLLPGHCLYNGSHRSCQCSNCEHMLSMSIQKRNLQQWSMCWGLSMGKAPPVAMSEYMGVGTPS